MRIRWWSVWALFGCLVVGCSHGSRAASEPEAPAWTARAAAQEPSAPTRSLAAVPELASAAAAVPPPESGGRGVAAPDPTEELLGMSGALTTSVGGPAAGALRGGVELPERGPGYHHNPRRPAAARFGTVETLQAMVRAAAVVERELPGSALVINDISLKEGGPIAQHGSHQSGRDVDFLFYALDPEGRPLPSVGVPLDPKGEGVDFKDLAIESDDQPMRIDLPRTWRFMQALLEEAPDRVQRIFIVEHIRSLLLAEAKRVRAPRPVVQRFEEVTCQPGTPHDDHVHVRFFCTPEDLAAGCEDSTPLYPWRVQQLAALGQKPVLASNKRTREERAAAAARTTTPAEARQRAGAMHAKVTAFLDQREAWLKQPHPGRPYCK